MSSELAKIVYGTAVEDSDGATGEQTPDLSYRAVGAEGVQTWEATLQRSIPASAARAVTLAGGWGVDDVVKVNGINYGSGWRVTASDAGADSVKITGTRSGVTPLEVGRPKRLSVTWNSAHTVATVANSVTGEGVIVSGGGSARGFRFVFTPCATNAGDLAAGGLLANLKNCAFYCGNALLGSVDVASLFAIGAGFLSKVTETDSLSVTWTPIRKWGDWYEVENGYHRDCYETAGRAAVAAAVEAQYASQINRALDAGGVSGLCGYRYTVPGPAWQSSYDSGTASFTSTVTKWHYEASAASLAYVQEAEESGPHWEAWGSAFRLVYFGQTLWTSP